MNSNTELNLAFKYYQSGNLQQAVFICKEILKKNPNEISVLHFIGIVYIQLQEYDAAIKYFKIALELDPNSFEGFYNLGAAFEKRGELYQALNCYQKVIQINPKFIDAYISLGNIFLSHGQFDKAISCYEKAIKLNPNNIGIYFNLGIAFQNKKQFDEAISCYQKVIQHNSEFADAYVNIGTALKEKGMLNDAITHYQKALDLNTTDPIIHILLGDAFKLKGQLDRALTYFQKAKYLDPDAVHSYINLGNVLVEKEQFDEAIRLYQEALQNNPHNDSAYCSIGNAFYQQGKLHEALAAYDKAIHINPKNYSAILARCISQLPIIYMDELSIHTSRDNYKNELLELDAMISLANQSDIRNAADAIGSRRPFYLAYQGLNDREIQGLYGKCLSKIMSSRYPQFMKHLPMPSRSLGEKMRIGFVSRYFYQHSVWNIPMKGWSETLDNTRFSLYGYHTGPERDKETEIAKDCFTSFVEDIYSFEELCKVIRADNLHVLIYPEIGMDPMTAKLASLRLAPIQCTSWGHPDTSGLPTIDYFISGELLEPVNGDEHYTEQLIRLPNLSIYYIPRKVTFLNISREALNLRQKSILYHCCQSIYKYLPQYDEIFPKIAQQLGDCQFLFTSFKNSHWLTEQFKLRIRNVFDRYNIDVKKHAEFLPYFDTNQYFGLYALSDVFLDPIGWSGCNSALEATDFNLPIVTFPSNLMRGRETAAILTMMNLRDTIADSLDDYINIAARLGSNPEWRKKISCKIADNKHLIYRDRNCITAFEDFLERVIQERLQQK